MVYLNWGHTITPSKLEAHLRFNWKPSLQHIQWSPHPQREKISGQPQLGLFSCKPCWFCGPGSCPDTCWVSLCYEGETMLQLPLGSLALSCCALGHRNRRHTIARRIPGVPDPERQFQQSPGRSHCSSIIVKSTGRGKTIWVFVGRCTCRALGRGTYKAKGEQRFSCLRGGEALALFCSCC